MNYTSSQSYHCLNHWQSNKIGKPVIPLPSQQVNAFVIGGVTYRLPSGMYYDIKQPVSNYVKNQTPLNMWRSIKPEGTVAVHGGVVLFNKIDAGNLVYTPPMMKRRGINFDDYQTTRTETHYKYSGGWKQTDIVNTALDVVIPTYKSDTTEVDRIDCVVPICDLYPVMWTEEYSDSTDFKNEYKFLDGLNNAPEVDNAFDSVIGIVGKSVLPENCDEIISDSYPTDDEYLVTKYNLNEVSSFGTENHINLGNSVNENYVWLIGYCDSLYKIRPGIRMGYAEQYSRYDDDPDKLTTYGIYLPSKPGNWFRNSNLEAAYHESVNNSGWNWSIGLLVVIKGWKITSFNDLTGVEYEQ